MESNNIDKISKALLSAQKEIAHAEMNQSNDYFGSSYANLESVIGACKNALNKNNISYIQGFDYQVIEGEHIFYITTTLIHDSGQTISNRVGLPVTKKDPHGIGSLCTYGRRYGLSAIVGISQADDDGNHGSLKPNKTKNKDKVKPVGNKEKLF